MLRHSGAFEEQWGEGERQGREVPCFRAFLVNSIQQMKVQQWLTLSPPLLYTLSEYEFLGTPMNEAKRDVIPVDKLVAVAGDVRALHGNMDCPKMAGEYRRGLPCTAA